MKWTPIERYSNECPTTYWLFNQEYLFLRTLWLKFGEKNIQIHIHVMQFYWPPDLEKNFLCGIFGSIVIYTNHYIITEIKNNNNYKKPIEVSQLHAITVENGKPVWLANGFNRSKSNSLAFTSYTCRYVYELLPINFQNWKYAPKTWANLSITASFANYQIANFHSKFTHCWPID